MKLTYFVETSSPPELVKEFSFQKSLSKDLSIRSVGNREEILLVEENISPFIFPETPLLINPLDPEFFINQIEGVINTFKN